jgi:hypothetical protein
MLDPKDLFLESRSQMGPKPIMSKMISIYTKHKLFKFKPISPESPPLIQFLKVKNTVEAAT